MIGPVRRLSTRAGAWNTDKVVAITGAEGGVGTVLRRKLAGFGYKIVAVTLNDTELDSDVFEHRVGNLTDATTVGSIFHGCDSIIHLAALPKPWETWENVYTNNIMADGLVFQQAAKQGVDRLVYASSCHSQHGSSQETTPETLKPDWGAHAGKVHTLTETPWPSSFYGAAKTLGEQLGRYYALHHGLPVMAVKIGWLIESDDPVMEAGGKKEEAFLRSLYLSHRDAANIFEAALNVDLTPHSNFGLVYASSANGRSMLDRASSEELLGYKSVDDAEAFFR